MKASRSAIACFLSVVCVSACATPWGAGLSEQTSDLPKVPNGLVVALDADGFAVASARLTGAMSASFDGNITFDEGTLADQVALSSRFPDWSVSVSGEASPAFGTLSASVGGPIVEIALDDLSVVVTLTDAQGFSCSGPLSAEAVDLSTRLALKSNKAGGLDVSLLDEPNWREPAPIHSLGDCVKTLTGDLQTTDAMMEDLWTVVGSRLLSEMAPAMQEALPSALGVDLGTRLTLQTMDPGLGDGVADFEVVAPEGLDDGPWAYSGDRFYVFFSLGMSALRHDCVPPSDSPLPALQSLPVPAFSDGDATMLMVNESGVLKALQLLWTAGRFCGDRALGDWKVPWVLAEGAWPELEALGSDALTVRVWPQSSLETEFVEAPTGPPRLRMSTNSLRVELYTSLDGTRVLAAAMDIDVEIEGELAVRPDRSVWLDADSITIAAAGPGESGIVGPPSDIVSTVGEPMAASIFEGLPLWQLPNLPVESSPPDIHRDDGYVVFAWTGYAP